MIFVLVDSTAPQALQYHFLALQESTVQSKGLSNLVRIVHLDMCALQMQQQEPRLMELLGILVHQDIFAGRA